MQIDIIEVRRKEKLQIIERIKSIVRENGHCNLQSQTILGGWDNNAKSVVGLIIKDGEFLATKTRDMYDWDITLNPNYGIGEKVAKKTLGWTKLNTISLIGIGLLSIIVMIVIALISK